MARINQGIFKETLNREKELINEYERLMAEYDDEIYRNFFEGLAQSSGILYDDMENFIRELKGMLNTTKFEESTGNKEKYESILNDMCEKQAELKSKFNDQIKEFNIAGGLMDYELRAIDGLRIWDRR